MSGRVTDTGRITADASGSLTRPLDLSGATLDNSALASVRNPNGFVEPHLWIEPALALMDANARNPISRGMLDARRMLCASSVAVLRGYMWHHNMICYHLMSTGGVGEDELTGIIDSAIVLLERLQHRGTGLAHQCAVRVTRPPTASRRWKSGPCTMRRK